MIQIRLFPELLCSLGEHFRLSKLKNSVSNPIPELGGALRNNSSNLRWVSNYSTLGFKEVCRTRPPVYEFLLERSDRTAAGGGEVI